MFDLNPEDMWMGPVPPKQKKRKAKYYYKKPKATRKQPTLRQTLKGAKATYGGAKKTYQYATKGYTGSAEEAYKKRQAKFVKAQRETKFKKKLKSEFGTRSVKSKVRGLFKRKQKSIYR